jgi:glutamyl-tRNA(Gln) amidotransferase subunit E
MNHIPEETRRANPDGTSSYMRPLPGRARMYPETDVPPIQITKALLKKAEKGESLEEKKEKLLKLLGSADMANTMLRSRNLLLFERLVDQGADPMLVAATLENTLVSLRREGIEIKNVDNVLPEVFALHEKNKIVKSAIPDILKAAAGGKSVHDVAKDFTLISGNELVKLVQSLNYDIKAIMSKYRTRIDPEELQKVLKGKIKD